MRRKLFNFAVGLSLVLFLATMVLWLRARFVQDVISASSGQDRLTRVHIKENGLVITSISGWPRREALAWRSARTGEQGYGIPVMFDAKSMSNENVVPGVSSSSGIGTAIDPGLPGAATTVVGGVRTKVVVIVWLWPLVIALGLAGPLTATALRRWAVRRNRRANGLCLSCGYDLRASLERCPECGTFSESPRAATA
jgi:hypothetical protein